MQQVDSSEKVAGKVIDSIDCGRGLQYFHHPQLSAGKVPTLLSTVRGLSRSRPRKAIEMVRSLDRSAISRVIITPPIVSLVSMVAWMAVYLRKPKDGNNNIDVQVVVATALTIASYLVTTGKRVCEVCSKVVTY